ncbi:glycosyltransferase domain protein, partial [Bacteroides fragilis str. 3783N1-2]
KHRLRGFWIIKTLSFMKLIMLSIIKRDFNYLHLLVKIQKI